MRFVFGGIFVTADPYAQAVQHLISLFVADVPDYQGCMYIVVVTANFTRHNFLQHQSVDQNASVF